MSRLTARLRVTLTVAIVALVATGCQLVGLIDTPTPYPCVQDYDLERCELMAEAVLGDAVVEPERVANIEIVPTPRPSDGIVTLGGPAPINVRVTLDDGSTAVAALCGGLSMDPMCGGELALRAVSVILGGYRDVPCFDADGQDCATPHPEIEPEAAAAAEPIEVDRLDIPIDHDGPYEVRVGEGSIPNGILSDASFSFADPWPDDVRIADSTVRIEVRSLEPDGKPFDNYYLHGWREGVERVEAVLVFEVTRFEPGAILSVEDVVVR